MAKEWDRMKQIIDTMDKVNTALEMFGAVAILGRKDGK